MVGVDWSTGLWKPMGIVAIHREIIFLRVSLSSYLTRGSWDIKPKYQLGFWRKSAATSSYENIFCLFYKTGKLIKNKASQIFSLCVATISMEIPFVNVLLVSNIRTWNLIHWQSPLAPFGFIVVWQVFNSSFKTFSSFVIVSIAESLYLRPCSHSTWDDQLL